MNGEEYRGVARAVGGWVALVRCGFVLVQVPCPPLCVFLMWVWEHGLVGGAVTHVYLSVFMGMQMGLR